MTIQTSVGWILDVSRDSDSNDIVISIKLHDSKIIRFKQRLHELIFYILPKSYSAGQDLFQQLSRHDQLIKRIFWDEKFLDLQDKTKTNLIGISLSTDRQDFKKLVQTLGHDSRVKTLYNIDLSEVTQFIYTQLKIPPTSKVEIEYNDDDAERLLSISKIDDSQEISSPFLTMYIEVLNEPATIGVNDTNKIHPLNLSMRINEQATTFVINSLSDPSFVSYITEYNPDIVIFCGDYNLLHSSNNKTSAEWANQKVIIHNQNAMHDIHLIELIEKARFSYLPLRLASRYGMIRLIDSRITFELLQREFVISARTRTISKHHEQIRHWKMWLTWTRRE